MGIKIIGTGHILEKSVAEVREAIEADKPGFVAVELDVRRFHVLESVDFKPSQLSSDVSLAGLIEVIRRGGGSLPVFMQYVLGLIQKDLGKSYGLAPGADMCAAIVSARSFSIPVALIDRDIEITLNRFMAIPLTDLLKLLSSDEEDLQAISSLVQTNIENILKKDTLDKLMNQLRNKHPKVYSAMVDERDQFMAQRLYNLQMQHPDKNILVVVGAGHAQGLARYLQEIGNGKEVDAKKLSEKKRISFLKTFTLMTGLVFVFILMKIQSLIHKRK